jgi:hypothetical protein
MVGKRPQRGGDLPTDRVVVHEPVGAEHLAGDVGAQARGLDDVGYDRLDALGCERGGGAQHAGVGRASRLEPEMSSTVITA